MEKQTIERETMSEQASAITSEDAAAMETSTEQIAAALRKKPRLGEGIIQTFLFLAGAISILTTIGIVYVLGTESINFFTNLSWEETNKEVVDLIQQRYYDDQSVREGVPSKKGSSFDWARVMNI